MGVTVSQFGEIGGQRVDQFRLTSDTGVTVDIIGYGVSVRDWRVPVAGGERRVVLGFDHLDAYLDHGAHFGAIAGRVANRIKDASFELDGEVYQLAANVGTLQLHGGTDGLGHQVWQGQADSGNTAVRFTHFSPDGAMGYPGNVNFAATYSLNGNRLKLELRATTDRNTPISLVQHQYFNLGPSDTVLDHSVQINSSAYTSLGEDLAPTGAILPSRSTMYDLRQPRTMRNSDGTPIDYDIGLVLDSGRKLSEPVATVVSPDKALTLKLWTDRPGVQFYNAVWTDMKMPGLDGKLYGKHSGFCLEDQCPADALHNPHFPNIIHGPDKPYSHWSEIEIG